MEGTIEEELKVFLSANISAEALCFIDDIVLGYIVSVLEQIGDEQFDVEEFADIMALHIPCFDTLNREEVCSWMLGLAEKLVYIRKSSNQVKEEGISTEDKNLGVPSSPPAGECHMGSISDKVSDLTISPDLKLTSCDGTHENKTLTRKICDGMSVLLEIFPEADSLEIEQCLSVANGDTEAAVQLMLLKTNDTEDMEEQGNSHKIFDLSPKAYRPSSKGEDQQETDEDNLKEQVMARYGYVDLKQDEKTHHPRLDNQENKKPFRYRDNQVVSTKGERFSLVKTKESEDMKKTYVNLRPARKYRFH